MTSAFDAIAKYSNISLDTLDVEDREFYENHFGIKFYNATSNQGICYGNWSKHPEVVIEAARFVKTKTGAKESTGDDFLEKVILYSIALSGKKQLQGLKHCVMSQIRPAYADNEEKTFNYAMGIIHAYEDLGVDRSRVVIKIPVTWESMHAAYRLEHDEKVKCLGTVVHSFEQGVVAAEAGCTYIAPYVDTFSEVLDASTFSDPDPEDNYGVLLTRKLQKYYRAYGIKTEIVIAALIGYRSVLAVSGVDEMTLSPVILNKLLANKAPEGFKTPYLAKSYSTKEAGEKISLFNDKKAYYAKFNANKTAVERYEQVKQFFTDADNSSKKLLRGIFKESSI
ncbi:hypothetical protein FOA43_004405 [Brettanomyces nanus]|uniref:Transaldolase n=1 Tax=Eeniella nana TaxID=13502 RepID=A0A875RQH8_EENNA|nr:uncharacterized protein FOA43_004405 [Brettanomyces nanus]QPG77010.1 hypothetical protein FOA43_004405 [Brettanomyces nanus]